MAQSLDSDQKKFQVDRGGEVYIGEGERKVAASLIGSSRYKIQAVDYLKNKKAAIRGSEPRVSYGQVKSGTL